MTVAYPSRETWPERRYTLPELTYPDKLNVCRELLDAHVQAGAGSSPAIQFGPMTISYEQLHREVVHLAGALHEQGVRPGDRVILRLLNRPQFISVWLALLRIGAVVVATPPTLKSRELNAIIENSTPAMLISEFDLWEEVEKVKREPVFVADVRVLHDLGAHTGPILECEPTGRDTLAIIAYTSGSTGTPKGCMHSHGDLLATTDSYARYILKPTPADRFTGHPTMAFVYGLGGLLLFPLRFGASTVLIDRFTPERFVDVIHDHKATIAFGAPTSLRMMMKDCADLKAKLTSLRVVVTAGETLPASVYNAWKETTGIEVLDGIGSTELLHIFVSGRRGRTLAGATGEAVPGYEAMVVDENTMEPLPDGRPGLLAVRGPTGCRYLNLPERQAQYVRDGWNLPGDIYVRDSAGFFHYQCRNDDLIICGGNNVAGPEIEGVMLEHPAVAEVAVVATPDELRGMVPKAFVVLRPGFAPAEELKAEMQKRVQMELASYKCPRKVDFVPELPKTSTGKIRRSELRRREFNGDAV